MKRIGIGTEDSPDLLSRLMPMSQQQFDSIDQKQRYIYMNPAQLLAYNFGARNTKVRMGRGGGKSTSILSTRWFRCVQSIPRAEGLFLGNSIKQLYTKTVPQCIVGLEMLGLREGVHFIRGHASKKMGFKEPLKKPRVWENVVHWYNGNCTYLISMAIRASANGFNAAYILADETRYLQPWRKVQEEILPTLRGGSYDHPGWNERENPFYLSQTWVSDAAITVKQQEWEKDMDDQTDDINEQIAEMLAELDVLPELAENERFLRKLRRLQCESRVFFNFSSIENVSLLGERYFRERKREMPELMFNIQILGYKKGVSRDGYYASFDPEIHTYMPSEESQTDAVYNQYTKKFVSVNYQGGVKNKVEWESVDLDATSKIRDCSLDTDILSSEPLRISFDVNTDICTMVTGQTQKVDGVESLVVLSSMFTKNDRKLRSLCGDWCRYYEPERRLNNNVILYYDSTMKQGGAYGLEEANDTRYFNVVKEELSKRKWVVTMVPMGTPMSHPQKFQYINDVLTGRQKPFIRLNRENNEYLIVAIENTKVKMSSRGPMKDKSMEKHKSEEGEAGLRETRTDITDALDTLLIGVRYFNSCNFYFSMPRLL
ncbi:MAG: hypothetical protein ACI36Z_09995 [Alloprevotella sp.]